MAKLTTNQEKWNKQLEEEYKKKKMQKIQKNIDPKLSLVEEYKQLQKEFIKIDNDETIKKWKILSKAYNIGKEIYGQDFSVLKLSQHFDIPYTTTKRVLSLDRANERTWKLIKDKKISAFKVAQICMTKNIKYQDQIVDLVIGENFSTTEIKNIRITENGLNVKTARLDKAIKEGYSKKSSAVKAIKETSTRMMKLLDLNKDDLLESQIPEIIEILDILQTKIGKKIIELIKN
jgi:hypothetical protein